MIKEIRLLKNIAKEKYIRGLQYREKIKTYVNSQGYVCYDTEELKAFQKSNKKGRPIKRTTNVEVVNE